MNLLIRSATIIDPKSEFHNQTLDILIEKNTIVKLSKRIINKNNVKELSLPNLHVSQGWFDSSVCFGEPGFEERETISNGLNTAASSGFTDVILNPLTSPVCSTGSDVAFLKSRGSAKSCDLHIYGALTKDSKGEELAELYDMREAGAVAFYDYQEPVNNANLMKVALQYLSTFNGICCAFPLNSDLSEGGVMNEGAISTALGLKGLPSISEEVRIARDIELLKYSEGSLHIAAVSSAGSVELIRKAKRERLDISCAVPVHNLFFTDEELNGFDSHFKVNPPLRTETDRQALLDGLKDGTIDMVTSDHNPLDIEHKKLEFDRASFGTIGLESSFGALNQLFPTKTAIKFLTRGRERFGIESFPIETGNKAKLTLFNPERSFTFDLEHIRSKSKNSIFLRSKLKGKVYGIINGNSIHLNQ